MEQLVEGTVDDSIAVLPYGIPLNGWKVIFQAFLTTLNVLCWLIPLRSKKISENKLALSLANAFSGGVFLSLAFGHLIPECVHGFGGYNEVTPYLLVLSGKEGRAFLEDGLQIHHPHPTKAICSRQSHFHHSVLILLLISSIHHQIFVRLSAHILHREGCL